MMVMLLGIFYNPTDAAYAAVEVSQIHTMQDVAREFAVQLPHYAREVLFSMLPVLGVFVIFQLFSRRYHRYQVIKMTWALSTH